jgi:hypothetical protein
MIASMLGTKEAIKPQIAPSTLWRYHEMKIDRFGRLSNVPVDTNLTPTQTNNSEHRRQQFGMNMLICRHF